MSDMIGDTNIPPRTAPAGSNIGKLGGSIQNPKNNELSDALAGKSSSKTLFPKKSMPVLNSPPKKEVEEKTNKDGSTTVQTYLGGKLTREEVYDKDGKLSSVTCYSAKLDGSMPSSSTYIDKDGDGYYDEVIEKTYDENGEVTSETRKEKEDINGEVHPEACKMDVDMLDFLTNGGNIK